MISSVGHLSHGSTTPRSEKSGTAVDRQTNDLNPVIPTSVKFFFFFFHEASGLLAVGNGLRMMKRSPFHYLSKKHR